MGRAKKKKKSPTEAALSQLKTRYQTPGDSLYQASIRPIRRQFRNRLSSKDITNFLASSRSYTLHRQYEKPVFNPYIVMRKRQMLQIDLFSVSGLSEFNDSIDNILVSIDCFSRKVWAEPLVGKSADAVLNKFRVIIQKTGPFEVVLSDRGKEFTNKKFVDFCKSKGMAVRNPRTSTHAAHVERVQRTLQTSLYRSISSLVGSNARFINRFAALVRTYNARRHRSTGLSPEEGEKDENKEHIQIMHQKYYDKVHGTKNIKFGIGDLVRLAKARSAFHRGYNPQSTEEVYVINKVNTSLPRVTYELVTMGGEIVCHNKDSQKKGFSTSRRFYQEQLTKVVGQDVYLIEEILATPDEKKEWAKEHDMIYVKWLDYAEPTYIKKSNMTAHKDVQKKIKSVVFLARPGKNCKYHHDRRLQIYYPIKQRAICKFKRKQLINLFKFNTSKLSGQA